MALKEWEKTLLSLTCDGISPRAQPPARGIEDQVLLNRAYAWCNSLTARCSRTFYLATHFLPAAKRKAIRALYAFCRTSDDLVDCPEKGITQAWMSWRQTILSRKPSRTDLVATAWADARSRYNIPIRYAEQLLNGIETDLCFKRYNTFEELAAYAYSVASTVGLMSMHIIGYSGREALLYAIKLGVALQITNILRDVGEDFKLGRVYLPQEELAAFDLTETDLSRGLVDHRWRSFMRFQIDRNRLLYQESRPGIYLLNREGHFSVSAAARLYEAILEDIENHDFDVFHRRSHLSGPKKLIRLPAILFQTVFYENL
jgi:15-cis-phytoene synthase